MLNNSDGMSIGQEIAVNVVMIVGTYTVVRVADKVLMRVYSARQRRKAKNTEAVAQTA